MFSQLTWRFPRLFSNLMGRDTVLEALNAAVNDPSSIRMRGETYELHLSAELQGGPEVREYIAYYPDGSLSDCLIGTGLDEEGEVVETNPDELSLPRQLGQTVRAVAMRLKAEVGVEWCGSQVLIDLLGYQPEGWPDRGLDPEKELALIGQVFAEENLLERR